MTNQFPNGLMSKPEFFRSVWGLQHQWNGRSPSLLSKEKEKGSPAFWWVRSRAVKASQTNIFALAGDGIGLTPPGMRPVRSLVLYFVLIFGGGALLAPWLYRATVELAPHSSVFAGMAGAPFHRFVARALLGAALIGLWPLLRSCGMWSRRELGLKSNGRAVRSVAAGFLLGFGSLACVALLAIGLGGRSLVHGHSSHEVTRYLVNATVAAVIVAMLEEFIFRGTVFGILRKTHPWPIALIVSSAVYALVHFISNADVAGPIRWQSGLVVLGKMFASGPPLVPAVLTLFVAGAILALAYQRTGALFFSMGLHAGWIFWLKSYGFLTAMKPGASAAWWGSSRLIDGWLALPVLIGVWWIVSDLKPSGERRYGN
jgi:uncharacterized protein